MKNNEERGMVSAMNFHSSPWTEAASSKAGNNPARLFWRWKRTKIWVFLCSVRVKVKLRLCMQNNGVRGTECPLFPSHSPLFCRMHSGQAHGEIVSLPGFGRCSGSGFPPAGIPKEPAQLEEVFPHSPDQKFTQI